MDVKRLFRKLTGTGEKFDFSQKTPYQILEIPKSSSPQDVKAAYYTQVKIFDPENHPDEFMVVRKAFETLQEPDKRAEADVKFLAHPAAMPGYREITPGTLSQVKLNKDVSELSASEDGQDKEALVRALKERSVVYVEKEEWPNALKDWEKILELNPNESRTKRNLYLGKFHAAFSLAKQNKHKEALEAFRKLSDENPNDIQMLLNVAILTDAAEGIGKASSFWNKLQQKWKSALGQSSDDEHLKNLIVQAQRKLAGHEEKAEDAVVPEVVPKKTTSTLQLANSLIEEKQYTRAISTLKSLLTQSPNNLEVMDSLGWAQLHSGQIDEAFKTWRKALREAKNNPSIKDSVTRAHFLLGKNFFEAGHLTPAVSHLKRAMAGDPKNLETYDLLAQIYLKKGNPNAAIDLWSKALRINPKSKQFQKSIRLAKLRTRK